MLWERETKGIEGKERKGEGKGRRREKEEGRREGIRKRGEGKGKRRGRNEEGIKES